MKTWLTIAVIHRGTTLAAVKLKPEKNSGPEIWYFIYSLVFLWVFYIYTCILHHLRVYYEVTMWPAPSWLIAEVMGSNFVQAWIFFRRSPRTKCTIFHIFTCAESVDIHVLTGFNKNIIFLTTPSLMWCIFILQPICQLRRTTDVFNESEFGQTDNLCKRGTDNIQRVRKLSVAKQMLAGLF